MKITIKSFWPAVIFLIGATVLFCLSGEEFPKKSWFDKIYLDKWIHVGLFTGLVLLWSLPLVHRIKANARPRKALMWTAIAFIGYGIVIEVIQGSFIPHRSFDVMDIAADALGCGLGFFLAKTQSKQNLSNNR
jgi:glycopeptide antibiotics resistance protein